MSGLMLDDGGQEQTVWLPLLRISALSTATQIFTSL